LQGRGVKATRATLQTDQACEAFASPSVHMCPCDWTRRSGQGRSCCHDEKTKDGNTTSDGGNGDGNLYNTNPDRPALIVLVKLGHAFRKPGNVGALFRLHRLDAFLQSSHSLVQFTSRPMVSLCLSHARR